MSLSPSKKGQGFTLAELLIALLIIGEIATFTIPKILTGQQNTKYKAMAKETMAAITEAYLQYKRDYVVTSSTTGKDFLDLYFNYLKRSTSGSVSVDTHPTAATSSATCGASNPCYFLHNGGILRPSNCTMGGSSTLNAVVLTFDPDGQTTNFKDSILFIVYYSGRITSGAMLENGTIGGGGGTCADPRSPDPLADPSWFSW